MEPVLVKKKFKFLSVCTSDIKKEVWETSDGTSFKKKSDAQGYQNKLSLLNKFKEVFNEGKNNFKIGDKNIALLYSSCFKGDWQIIDHFCVKVSSEIEVQEFSTFCKSFYELQQIGPWDKREEKISLGWLFVFIVTKQTKIEFEDYYYKGEKFGYYLSEKMLEGHLQLLQNNLPLGIIEENKKINNRKSLLDID